MVGSAGGGGEEGLGETRGRKTSRRDQARMVGAAAIGAVAVLFAVLNFDEVEVNWLLGTWSTPLILVIAISFLLGAGAGFLVAHRRPGAGSRRSRRRR